MHNVLSLITLRAIINNFVIAVIAYVAGYEFTSLFHVNTAVIGGLWAVISGVVVIESKRADTWESGKFRVIGSFIGALISGLYLYYFSFSAIGFAFCIAAGVLVCHLLGLAKYMKLTSITISVVMIVSLVDKDLDPFLNAALRFAESVIGTAVAVTVAYVSHWIYSEDS